MAHDATDSSRADEVVWTEDRLKNPHAVADKQRRVRDMFAAISPRYDLNNRVHSLGIDQRWRRKAVKLSRLKPLDVVVDVACGTGDLTLAFANQILDLRTAREGFVWDVEVADQVIGIDYTFQMLPRAVAKAEKAGFGRTGCVALVSGRDGKTRAMDRTKSLIAFTCADAQNLPLPDACCDVASIAFGIRNVADPMRALREFRRILRPGGRLVVLEFSRPTNPVIRRLYDFYCNQIMTRTAAWIARDRTGAYRYLSASVETFKTREQMKADIESAGFRDVEVHPLTFGVAVVYVGFVNESP